MQSSEVIAEKINEWIETEECMNACGVERMAVGMSTDALVDGRSARKLCSPNCYNKCPNILELYFNLAAGEGNYAHQSYALDMRHHILASHDLLSYLYVVQVYTCPACARLTEAEIGG